ncbi:MAG: MMPL family transporter [Bacteroidetes bacterium]|nr:MMPL family transporter [Bacteroidota bacterium]
MWHFLVRHILRDRVFILIVIGLITLFMGYKAREVKLSYEMARMLPASDSTTIIYENFKKQFGEDGSVLFIGIEDKNLFTLNKFNDWYDLSGKIRKIKGVEEVLSNTRLFNLRKNDSLKKFEFISVTPVKPKSQAEADSLKKVIWSIPLYRNLIYNQATGATIMMVTISKNEINNKSRIQLIKNIKTTADSFGSKYNIPVHYSGLPYIRTVTSKKVEDELKLFVLLALLVAAVFLYIFFRSYKAVLFPMIIIVISVIWAVGFIVLFGYKITILTGIIPPLIIVIGVENCIFLLNKYHYEFRHHGNKVKSLSRVIERIGKANLLTNAATATGFAAFIITNNKLLVEFGMIASLNILVVYVLSLTLVPIFFSYIKPPEKKDTKHLEHSFAKIIIDKAVIWVNTRRNTIYITTGIFMLIAVFGTLRLHTTGRVMDDIPKRDALYKDLMFFEQNFKGIMPLEITVDAKRKKGVFTLATLRRIDRLQDTLATYPELSRPLSIVEVIKMAKMAFYNGDTNNYNLPSSGELTFMASYIPDLKSKKKNLVRNFIDSNYQVTRISVQMANIGTPEIERIQTNLKPKIDSIFPPAKYTVTLTGTSVVFLKGTNFLIRNLWESILLAVVVIAILLAFLFTSWRMILISLVPNLIPQLMTAALMGYAGIPIKPSTILIFSVALGISVDNSIQYLSRYRLQLKHTHHDIPSSVISALKETGYSMIYSSTVLFFGFGIFVLSSFGGTQSLGFLISFTLLVAGLLNMFILPSLLLTLDKWSTTKAFEEKKPMIDIYREEEEEENAGM